MTAQPQLTWWHFCIVRGSRRLSGDAKHVWEVIRELHGPRGCYMGPLEIAQQIGIPLGSLDDHRAELQRLGLLVRVEAPGSKVDFWFTVFPIPVDDHPPSGSQAKRQWIREWAETLDDHIRACRERAS